jgi:hypothetical protein
MNKDLMYVILGTILMFVFVVFMFRSFNTNQEIKLIETKIKIDSVNLNNQKLLQLNDSLLQMEQTQLRRMLNTHSTQIKRIQLELDSLIE